MLLGKCIFVASFGCAVGLKTAFFNVLGLLSFIKRRSNDKFFMDFPFYKNAGLVQASCS